MSAKKWLVMFAAALLLALCAYGACNILIDPFGVFGDPILDWYGYDETNNPRTAKLAYLEREHDRYDSYIIGSSSAASYDPEELNAYLDARFYNLFVYGCDTKDYCQFADYVLEHYEVKHLILNLGLNETGTYDIGEDSLNSRMHALASRRSLLGFYAAYAFCSPRYALDKLSAYRRDTELPQTFDVFRPEDGTYDKRVRDVEKIGDPDVYLNDHGEDFPVRSYRASLPYLRECVECVADIRRKCEEQGVDLTVIASPVYIGQWELYDPQDLREYRQLLADASDFWDFGLTPLSYDSRYFYDETHFRNAVGTMVLATVFGNEEVWRPERFGVFVTAENCAAHMDRLLADPPVPDSGSLFRNVPVLMYHHFLPKGSGDNSVSAAEFEAQLKALKEAGCTAVTMADLIDYVYRGGELPDKPVCITMDDGYYSNYEIAWPLLEKYGMKATVFAIGVSVGHMEHYKDTDYPITPHFGYDEAREMLASGTVDFQSHTYDMHQWAPYEDTPPVRASILPFPEESEADYAAVLREDLARYEAQRVQELGGVFTALAYPGGQYCTLSEVLVHEAGIPVTFSVALDRRNVLIRGLPQSLYALCRYAVDPGTDLEALMDYVLSDAA